MAELLVVLGLSGIVFGVVNLIRPIGRFGFTNRRQMGAAFGASVMLMMAGGAAASPGTTPDVVAVEQTTSTEAAQTTTSVTEPTDTTFPGTTSVGEVTTTSMSPGSVSTAPPVAGPSGDPTMPMSPGAELATVVAITDGDTLTVQLADGATEKLRLIGINTPESGECFADEATAVLGALAPVGSPVGLTTDVNDRDQFDRLLRYVWVGAMSVNEEMVRRGAAIARRYAPDTTYADRLEEAQIEASALLLGLWGPSVCGPASDATIEIFEINYDAPGDDNNNLNGEWVAIKNQGVNLADLTGWTLKDESASHRFSFPAALILGAGEVVTVYTGCGDDFGTDLYWCNTGSAVWNNDGDTAFLLDANGNTHHSSSYTPPTTTTSRPSTTTTTASAATTTAPSQDCEPSYPTVCIPSAPPDLDCGEIPHRRFKVVGSDPHGFDGDNDGIGCES
jgi:micrococcal nuclease